MVLPYQSWIGIIGQRKYNPPIVATAAIASEDNVPMVIIQPNLVRKSHIFIVFFLLNQTNILSLYLSFNLFLARLAL
jgi:hypothetical protein